MCVSARSSRMTVVRQKDNANLVSKEVVWLIQAVADTFYKMQKADVTSEALLIYVPS
jgi:hypothetical protein